MEHGIAEGVERARWGSILCRHLSPPQCPPLSLSLSSPAVPLQPLPMQSHCSGPTLRMPQMHLLNSSHYKTRNPSVKESLSPGSPGSRQRDAGTGISDCCCPRPPCPRVIFQSPILQQAQCRTAVERRNSWLKAHSNCFPLSALCHMGESQEREFSATPPAPRLPATHSP